MQQYYKGVTFIYVHKVTYLRVDRLTAIQEQHLNMTTEYVNPTLVLTMANCSVVKNYLEITNA